MYSTQGVWKLHNTTAFSGKGSKPLALATAQCLLRVCTILLREHVQQHAYPILAIKTAERVSHRVHRTSLLAQYVRNRTCSPSDNHEEL